MTIRKLILLLVVFSILASCSDVEKLQPISVDATILAFGDSLTYGTGSNGVGSYSTGTYVTGTSRDKAYPAQLALLTGHNVINAGKPGEISRNGLLRLPGLIEKYQPKLIIICHGGNDILQKIDPQQTRSNLQQMINLARENSSQVVLIGVPEFGLFLSASPIYEALAEQNHLPIENDIIGEIIGNNALKSDHIHPNAEGYRLLAEKIFLLLQQSGAITSN